MTTRCTTYSTEVAARDAVAALRDAGVPARDIRLLAGRRPGDIGREPVGGFAGSIGPDAPVGTYGGKVVLRRQGTGGFAGDPDQQRQGSFADSDRVVVTSDEIHRARVTGLRGARRLLSRAALSDHEVHHAMAELHAGHAIVLVDLRDMTGSAVAERLQDVPRAA
jgi:hypothetical protein